MQTACYGGLTNGPGEAPLREFLYQTLQHDDENEDIFCSENGQPPIEQK